MLIYYLANNEYSLRTRNKDFQDSVIYKLPIKKKICDDKRVVQNAAYLCCAIYDKNPHETIRQNNEQRITTITKVIHVGDLLSTNTSDEGQAQNKQRCVFALDETQQTMYLALRGSADSTDWAVNLDYDFARDSRFVGKMHQGFWKRSQLIDMDDLYALTLKHQTTRIVFCGHSLGGAVSSLMYLQFVKHLQIARDANCCEDVEVSLKKDLNRFIEFICNM